MKGVEKRKPDQQTTEKDTQHFFLSSGIGKKIVLVVSSSWEFGSVSELRSPMANATFRITK